MKLEIHFNNELHNIIIDKDCASVQVRGQFLIATDNTGAKHHYNINTIDHYHTDPNFKVQGIADCQ